MSHAGDLPMITTGKAHLTHLFVLVGPAILGTMTVAGGTIDQDAIIDEWVDWAS